MKRIYDAMFSDQGNSKHEHIEKLWWVEGSSTGTWTRNQAYDYVVANPRTVYVSESDETALVYPYHRKSYPTIRWVQTKADGLLPDNLITLARRHKKD